MGKIHYNLKPMCAQEAVNQLCKYLLGENWYIADPVNNLQANAIIVDEIKAKYPPSDRSFNSWLKWKFER